jgi:hypothetical protein
MSSAYQGNEEWWTSRFKSYAAKIYRTTIVHWQFTSHARVVSPTVFQAWYGVSNGLTAVLPSLKKITLTMYPRDIVTMHDLDTAAIHLLSLPLTDISTSRLSGIISNKLLVELTRHTRDLRCLKIKGAYTAGERVNIDLLDFSLLQRLQRVSLHNVTISWQTIQSILCLNTLEHISLEWLFPEICVPPSLSIVNAPLVTLAIEACPTSIIVALESQRLGRVTWYTQDEDENRYSFHRFIAACAKHTGIKEINICLGGLSVEHFYLSIEDIESLISDFHLFPELTKLDFTAIVFPKLASSTALRFIDAIPARVRSWKFFIPPPMPWIVFHAAIEKLGGGDMFALALDEAPPSPQWTQANIRPRALLTEITLSGDPGTQISAWAEVLGYAFPGKPMVFILEPEAKKGASNEHVSHARALCALMGVKCRLRIR